jgi:CheY-specific phosphatase CheX
MNLAGEVFEIMLGSRLQPVVEPQTMKPSEITSMVGLAGQLCGVLTPRCSFVTAAMMASKMLGVEPNQADQQMWDAIGEIYGISDDFRLVHLPSATAYVKSP